MKTTAILFGAASALGLATGSLAQSITVATVNNADMIRMQGLTSEFNAAHPDITVNWVTLEENILRERVTTDIATGGGQYDVMTIGNYEVPIWAKQGWLTPLEFGADYDVDDMLPAIRGGLTVDGTLYAAPFYGESAMIMYRTDLMEAAGLEMPEEPTWEFIAEAARAMTDRANDINGICLRGKAGWGENMAFLTALNNSFGGKMVRRGLGAAVRPADLEGIAAVLRRPDEGRGPGGRLVERVQREPDAVPAGQVRHVDRRHRRRRLVVTDPNELDHRRQGGLRAVPQQGGRRQPRQLAVVLEPGDPGLVEERRRGQDLHRRGRPPRATPSSSPRRRAGPRRLRAPAPRSTRTRTTRRPRPSPGRRSRR